MEYIHLSSTDFLISRLAMGCEPLGSTDWGSVDESQALSAVSRALESGINLFDTADVYGLGRSEILLSKALGPRRHDVAIVTKFGVNWRRTQGGRAKTFFDSSPDRVRQALEDSLRRLRIDSISLYLVHWPDPNTPIEATMQTLLDCQRAGKVKCIGVSNFSAPQIREAVKIADLTVVESQYSLINRTVEGDILPLCHNYGIDVLAYGTLGQGLLTGKYGLNVRFPENDRRHRLPSFQGDNLQRNLETVERVRQIAHKYRKSASQVAIRWVLDHPAISAAIVGIKDSAQLEANVGAFGWNLSTEDRLYLQGEVP